MQPPDDGPDGLDTQATAAIVRARLFEDAEPYRIGRFTVLERIGAGGMGVVYAAFDAELDRRVAIKLLLGQHDDAERGRIVREAKAMAKLAHPNVAHVYEVGTHGSHTYIAMEHVRGRTLRAWIGEHSRPWREVLAMFVQAGRGLAAAHAAGIVHRDFKPDNVIVGDDERARVLDFGLARIGEPLDATVSHDALETTLASGTRDVLTKTGAVLGTPAYMAPEHARGDAVDARGDQFSFCVALWEGLAGSRPFVGSSFAELLDAVEHGRITAAPRTAMPGFIAVELRRGLAAAPDDRHPSMQVLLDRLERDPTVARRRVVFLGIGGIVTASVLGWQRLDRVRDEQACDDAGQAIAADWSSTRATEIEDAFTATELAHAADTFARVRTRIDAFADAWSSTRTTTCIAGLDTGALERDRIDACFDERRAHLVALVEQLAKPDAGILQQAVISAAALPSPEACADPRGPMPNDRIPAAIRAELARITVLRTTGRWEDAIAAATALHDAIAHDGPESAQADVDLALGTIENARGHYPEAQAALERSFYAAGAAGADELMLQAARTLVDNVGYRQADVAQGRRWYALANMLVARLELGDHPEVAALENSLGLLEDLAGELDESLAAHERSLAIRERVLGADHPDVAGSLFNIGTVHAERGALDEALAAYERSLALDERTLGPNHPHVAGTLNSIGQLLAQRGDVEQAQAVLERALAIKERTVGPEHPSIGTTVLALGHIEKAHGRNEQALAHYRRARAVFEAALGPTHPNSVAALQTEGSQLAFMDRYDEGLPLLRRALEIQEDVLGPDHSDLAGTLHNLGGAVAETGQLDEGMALIQRGIAAIEKHVSRDHPDIAVMLITTASIHAQQGRLDDAVEDLERSLALMRRAGVDRAEQAVAKFMLAKLLAELGRDPERATALAREARETHARQGSSGADSVKAIDAWLATRPQ